MGKPLHPRCKILDETLIGIIGERSERDLAGLFTQDSRYICIYYIPYALTVHFPITSSMRYQPIFHTLYFTLHCTRLLNNVILTTVIVMAEILNGRVGTYKCSVERVRHVICYT